MLRVVDATDFRLLALLHENGSASQAAIARRLGLAPSTVTRRLARSKASGALRGSWTYIHPSLFGRRGTIVAFAGGKFSGSDARKALGMPDVVWASLKHNGDLALQLATRGDAHEARSAIERALRAKSTWELRERDPATRLALTPVRARILDALVLEPRASPERLARRANVSPKTARKHVRMLADAGLVDVQPILGASLGAGIIAFHVAVLGPRLPTDAALRRAAPGAAIIERLDGAVYLLAQAPDLAGVDAVLASLRALRGVRDARPTLHKEFLVATDRIRAWLSEAVRAGSLEATRGRRP